MKSTLLIVGLMKKINFLTYLLGCSLLMFSCTKSTDPLDPNNPNNGGATNLYTGSDLSAGENVIDSIIVPGTTKTKKFDYWSKYKLKRILATWILYGTSTNVSDSIYYSGNIVNKISVVPQPAVFDNIYFEYQNNLISRLFRTYEENPIPGFGKLGTYFTYNSNNLLSEQTRAAFQTNSNSVAVDTIKYLYQSNQITQVIVQDIDFLGGNRGTPWLDTLDFFYSTVPNKLKQMANFDLLNFYPTNNSYVYTQPTTPDIFFDMDIASQFNISSGAYANRINSIISYIFFKNDNLPIQIKLTIKGRGSGGGGPSTIKNLYCSYNYNSNGYPNSIAVSPNPTFNHNQFEKVKLTYY